MGLWGPLLPASGGAASYAPPFSAAHPSDDVELLDKASENFAIAQGIVSEHSQLYHRATARSIDEWCRILVPLVYTTLLIASMNVVMDDMYDEGQRMFYAMDYPRIVVHEYYRTNMIIFASFVVVCLSLWFITRCNANFLKAIRERRRMREAKMAFAHHEEESKATRLKPQRNWRLTRRKVSANVDLEPSPSQSCAEATSAAPMPHAPMFDFMAAAATKPSSEPRVSIHPPLPPLYPRTRHPPSAFYNVPQNRLYPTSPTR